MALTSKITAIADAIRGKTGGTEKLTLDAMPTEITNIYGYKNEDALITRTLEGEYTNDRINTVGWGAFKKCFITSVNLPNVTKVDYDAFNYCINLTTVNIPKVKSLGGNTFSNCIKLTSVDFPEVTTIDKSEFEFCNALTSVNLPLVTSEIKNHLFYFCQKLTFVNLPLVTSIEAYAYPFMGCDKLTTLKLPSLMSANQGAFSNSSITSLILSNTEQICTLLGNVFTNSPIEKGTGYIYVPDELVESYKVATNWSEFADQIKPLSEYVEA